MVPADAEIVLEGYLDEHGWYEKEGPYGEFVGYYGAMKTNPVFHLTAITMRRDALVQTLSIGGHFLKYTDTSQLSSMLTETAVWTSLESAIREPVALYCPPSAGGMFNVRLSMRSRFPGEARNAIAAAFSSTGNTKHVFVVDDDIDVFSDEQMEWALATRFQADRNFVAESDFRAVPIDPSLRGSAAGAKAGFDLTLPPGWRTDLHYKVPSPPTFGAATTSPISVAQALNTGPKFFRELMELTGSRDGRDVTLALDALRASFERLPDGRYALKGTGA
jgi:2,5-furandicarboxylate decarboxylase 1